MKTKTSTKSKTISQSSPIKWEGTANGTPMEWTHLRNMPDYEDVQAEMQAKHEKFQALKKALNDAKLKELMEAKPSQAEVEQNIAKTAKSLPKTPQIDEVQAQRAKLAFEKMMKNQNLSNVGLDEAGAANPKALAGAVVPGILGMLAGHVIGKTPDLQLDLKDVGEGSDIVPKDESHFNEDRKFKKLRDILENR